MPYDPKAVREDLKLLGAYASHPMAEFVLKLGAHLAAAQEEISAARADGAAATSARNKAEGELEAAQATIHRLRNGATGMNELIDALKAIARNPKGAAKVAKDALAAVEGKDAS
jgi:chromosome segregation ATPase